MNKQPTTKTLQDTELARIKNHIEIFYQWQKEELGYRKYKARITRDEIMIDAYTRTGLRIRLKKSVLNEDGLKSVILEIIKKHEEGQ